MLARPGKTFKIDSESRAQKDASRKEPNIIGICLPVTPT
jgi:hypothetical protein